MKDKPEGRSKKDLLIDEQLENSSLDDFDIDNGIVCEGNLNFKSTVPTSIRILSEDISLAKQISKEKGIKYQTLLKMYIHEGLKNDKKILLG